MKLKFIAIAFCSMLLFFTQCSNPTVYNLFSNMEECQVSGVVRDESGKIIDDVEAISGREKTTTNARGVFRFEKAKVNNERCVITFQKEGYCSVTRSCPAQENVRMDVVMLSKMSKDNLYAKKTISGVSGGVVSLGKVKVTIPGNVVNRLGMVHADDCVAEVFYLDPNNKNFQDAIPGGDLEAVRSDNSSTLLKSYGMLEVTLTDKDGSPLQLGKDEKASLTFPVPEGLENNTPDSIPLWAFNEDKGIWEEEGMARYDTKTQTYSGSVSHFSWHNLDVPSERVTVKGKVVDCDGNGIGNVKVIVGQTSAITDASGEYRTYIPQNTDVDIYVRSSDYYNYKEEKPVSIQGTMESNVEAPTITLPCMLNMTGKIKNSCGDQPLGMVYLDYTIDNKQYTTAPIWSNANDGSFSIMFPKNTTMLMLHVESGNGNTMPRPYLNPQANIDAGEIEVCLESQEKEVINITNGDQTYQMPANEQNLDVASDIGGIYGMFGELIDLIGKKYGKIDRNFEISPRFITISSANEDTVLTIHVKSFAEGRSTYDAEVSYCMNGMEASGMGFFTVVGHKDKSTLLTLSCVLSGNKKNAPITVMGMFSIPDMVNGKKLIGSIDHVPSSCPSFPKPILSTYQYKIDNHWITGAVYNGSDHKDFKKKLLEAGAICLEEKKDGGSDDVDLIFYHNDYMLVIDSYSIIVMDNPSDKEKKKYTLTEYEDGKYRTVEREYYEIEALEVKALSQTSSTHPVILKEVQK